MVDGIMIIFDKLRQVRLVLVMGLLILVVAVIYGPSLRNGFVHDDEGQIVQNPFVQDLQYTTRAFTSCIWEVQLGTCQGTTSYYRPLQTLSYIISWTVASQPSFFHLVNLLYYLGLAVVVWLFLRIMLPNTLSSGVAFLLWLVHPTHTEAVMWIASVPELLYSLLVVAALLIHVRQSKWQYRAEVVAGLFFLALLAKETAIMLPAVLLVIDVLWRGKKITVAYLSSYRSLGIAVAVYLLLRVRALGGLVQDEAFFSVSKMQWVLSSIATVGEYVTKTVWPVELNPFIPFELTTSVRDWDFVIGLIALAVIIGGARWAKRRHNRVVLLGLSIFVFFLIPVVLPITQLGENVVAERYLLLPSLGVAMIAGWLTTKWYKLLSRGWRIVPGIGVGLIALIWSQQVLAYNPVWQSSQTFYEYAHEVNARHGQIANLAYYNLGTVYEQQDQHEDAQRVYEDIIISEQHFPSIYKTYNNLGKIYANQNRHDEAIELYNKSLAEQPSHIFAMNNLGISYLTQQRYSEALEKFIQALEIDPAYPEAQHNLQFLYQNLVELADAPDQSTFRKFLDMMTRNHSWRTGQHQGGSMQVQEIRPGLGNGVQVTIAVDPSAELALAPAMIFYRIDNKVYLIPAANKVFDANTGTISLQIEPSGAVVTAKGVELYLVMADFRYYVFTI
jgi:Tfp pilus assembly protein PilF